MGKYTYDEYEDLYKKSGVKLSDADRKLALENPDAGISLINDKIGYQNASTQDERDRYHQNAEATRKNYGGYSGDTDGSGYRIDNSNGTKNKYDEVIDNAIGKILNRGEFEYDWENDQAAQNYRKQYAREGERAMRDTLAAAGASTGGIPSSYAVSAAAQARNYYAAQAADKYDALYNAAYDRWLDSAQLDQQTYSMLASERAARQQTEADTYNRKYQEGRDAVSDSRYDTEWQNYIDQQNWEREYQTKRDAESDRQWQAAFDYQQQQDALDREEKRAQSASSGGGYSGSGSYDDTIEEEESIDVSKVLKNLPKSVQKTLESMNGNDTQMYRYLSNMGYSDREANAIVNSYYVPIQSEKELSKYARAAYKAVRSGKSDAAEIQDIYIRGGISKKEFDFIMDYIENQN